MIPQCCRKVNSASTSVISTGGSRTTSNSYKIRMGRERKQIIRVEEASKSKCYLRRLVNICVDVEMLSCHLHKDKPFQVINGICNLKPKLCIPSAIHLTPKESAGA